MKSDDLTGVLHPDGRLELSGKLTVPPGRVRVIVESLEPQQGAAEDLVTFVRGTRRELEAAGHRFRTQAEIDSELNELRSEWDDGPDRPGDEQADRPHGDQPAC
jgi:hypothetical protein